MKSYPTVLGRRLRRGVATHKRLRSVAIIATSITLASVGLAACSSSSGGSATDSHTTLTMAIDSAPLSLSPVGIANGQQQWLVDLAYMPLVDINTSGKVVPGLAKSWTVASDNKSIDFLIDSRGEFADGTAVTATAVANSLNYFIKNSTGPQSGLFTGLKAAAGSEAGHVVVTSQNANPDLPLVFTPNYLGGDIISPAGLANPKSLSSGTYGAGPYQLDASQTVSGDHYTYVPNPHYTLGAVHFQKVVVKLIAQTDARLSALKAGQINAMIGSPDTVASAQSAKLEVSYGIQAWGGLMIADRNGALVPALKSVQVRQALNYAIDRESITKATVGQYGKSNQQPNSEGFQGYDPSLNSTYTYDVAKAKQLLADAGYPNGFTFSATYLSNDPVESKVLQAIASQLAAVNVTLQLKGEANSNAFVKDIFSKQVSAIGLSFGGQPQFANVPLYFLPKSPLNPFGVVSPKILGTFAQYTASPASSADKAANANQKAVMDEAPSISVVQTPQFIYSSTWLKGVGVYSGGATTNPRFWSAE